MFQDAAITLRAMLQAGVPVVMRGLVPVPYISFLLVFDIRIDHIVQVVTGHQ
jgi:hypothetical protein